MSNSDACDGGHRRRAAWRRLSSLRHGVHRLHPGPAGRRIHRRRDHHGVHRQPDERVLHRATRQPHVRTPGMRTWTHVVSRCHQSIGLPLLLEAPRRREMPVWRHMALHLCRRHRRDCAAGHPYEARSGEFEEREKALSRDARERTHIRRPATSTAHLAGPVGTGTQRRSGAGTVERQRQARRPVGLTRIISRQVGLVACHSSVLRFLLQAVDEAHAGAHERQQRVEHVG
jgi:hypothetical protein